MKEGGQLRQRAVAVDASLFLLSFFFSFFLSSFFFIYFFLANFWSGIYPSARKGASRDRYEQSLQDSSDRAEKDKRGQPNGMTALDKSRDIYEQRL